MAPLDFSKAGRERLQRREKCIKEAGRECTRWGNHWRTFPLNSQTRYISWPAGAQIELISRSTAELALVHSAFQSSSRNSTAVEGYPCWFKCGENKRVNIFSLRGESPPPFFATLAANKAKVEVERESEKEICHTEMIFNLVIILARMLNVVFTFNPNHAKTKSCM